MTLLSDGTLLSRLRGDPSWEPWQRIRIEPFEDSMLQPSSVDVHLGARLQVYTGAVTDTRRDNSPWWETLQLSHRMDEVTAWVLQPQRFYLAVLEQYIRVPEDCCGQVNGISSRARDGVTIHQQAGLLDPGWEGWATLEMTVENPNTVLYPHQRIGQVTFQLLDQRCMTPYSGRYQGDRTPQPARVLSGKERQS
jgi:dCTP deaminase